MNAICTKTGPWVEIKYRNPLFGPTELLIADTFIQMITIDICVFQLEISAFEMQIAVIKIQIYQIENSDISI